MDTLIQTVHHILHKHPLPGPDTSKKLRLQALDDYSRLVEDYLEVVEDITESLGQGVKRLRRRQRIFQKRMDEAEANAKQFQQEGQYKLARAAANRKKVLAEAVRAYKHEADLQNARLLQFMDARLALEARLTEVNWERARLESLLSQEGILQPL